MFKGGRGFLYHLLSFILTHAYPRPSGVCVSTCRKWATCFQKVIPSPVWAAKLIRIYHPVKRKERKSPVFRSLSRCGRQKRFPLSLLGKPPQMRHSLVTMSHWFLETSWLHNSVHQLKQRETIFPNTTSVGDLQKYAWHVWFLSSWTQRCDSYQDEHRSTEKALLVLYSIIG